MKRKNGFNLIAQGIRMLLGGEVETPQGESENQRGLTINDVSRNLKIPQGENVFFRVQQFVGDLPYERQEVVDETVEIIDEVMILHQVFGPKTTTDVPEAAPVAQPSAEADEPSAPAEIKEDCARANIASSESTEDSEAETADDELGRSEEAAKLFRTVCKYIEKHRQVRRNMVTGLTEWSNRDVPGSPYVVVDNEQMGTLSTLMFRDGILCSFSLFKRICQADIYPHYDPLTDFMQNLPQWDGHDHLGDFIHRLTRDAHAEEGMRMWMRAIAAKMMHHDEQTPWANMLMPILVGGQGMRKTTFTRMILPVEGFFSQNIDFSPKGDWPKKLTRYILINDDEFDRHGASQLATMKSAISTSQVMMRIPYSRQEKAFTRLAAMIGTSNQLNLLQDDTGSRRFLIIHVNEIVDTTTPVPYEQLYAQLKEELAQGLPYYPTKAFEQANEHHNALYYETNVAEEYFYRHYNFAREGQEGAQWISTTEIYENLCKAHPTLKQEITKTTVFGKKLKTVAMKYCEREGRELPSIFNRGEGASFYYVRRLI